jgi:hypothetical protein
MIINSTKWRRVRIDGVGMGYLRADRKRIAVKGIK